MNYNYKTKYVYSLFLALSILVFIIYVPNNYQAPQSNPDTLDNTLTAKTTSISPHSPLNYASPKEIGSKNEIIISNANISDRNYQDQPDDFEGSQFHAMYSYSKKWY